MHERRLNLWIVAVGLAAFFFHLGGYWSATWWSKWFVLSLGFAAYFSAWVARKTSWWYLPIVLLALVNASAMAFWSQKTYASSFDPLVAIVLQKDSLFSLITVVAVTLFFANWRKSWASGGQLFMICLWAIGTTAFITMPPGMPPNNGWQFGNPSMAACLLAILLPYTWQKVGFLLHLGATLLTILVIYRIGASQPYGVFSVVLLAYWCHGTDWRKVWKRTILPCAALFMVMMTVGNFLVGKEFLDDNGRFEIYRLAWSWTQVHGLFWTGWGAGAVQTVMPILQITEHIDEAHYFMWLHSDWFQIFIELGIFGLAFSLLAFGRLAYRAATNHNACDQAALWGFAAMALFNYPLRMPLTVYCLVLVCCRVEAGVSFAEDAPESFFEHQPSFEERTNNVFQEAYRLFQARWFLLRSHLPIGKPQADGAKG